MLSREKIEREEPSIDTSTVLGGIEYHDGILIDNDARFVFSFVRSAIEAGAAAANYVELVSAERSGDRWTAHLRDVDSGEEFTTTASTIVNAAGPFVDELNTQWGLTSSHRIVYSKGIHLVVPRLTTTDHNKVLAFFDDTQRLFYVIPMGRRSVIGTTDTRVDTPVHRGHRRRHRVPPGADQRPPRPRAPTRAVRHHRRTMRRAAARGRRWAAGDQSEVDWTKLSRKHAVEVDRTERVVTIFGGKLTDCLNVGEEVAAEIESLGIPLEKDLHNWYGEPAKATRDEFYRQARLMRLDDLRSKADTEPLTDRLWRRYGRRAFAMLDAIREDPTMAEDIMGSADYLRVELRMAAFSEMITKLEDFMRRRSKIELVVHDADIANSAGLREVAEILFGDDADRRLAEYFGGPDAVPDAVRNAPTTTHGATDARTFPPALVGSPCRVRRGLVADAPGELRALAHAGRRRTRSHADARRQVLPRDDVGAGQRLRADRSDPGADQRAGVDAAARARDSTSSRC